MPPAPRPTPKKRRAGLIVALVVVVLVVVVVGVGGGLLLLKKGGTSSAAGTPGAGTATTRAGTATPGAPAGFQQFRNSVYRLLYPTGWLAQETPVQQGTEEQFVDPTSSGSRSLKVDVFDKTRPAKDEDDALCLEYSGNPTAHAATTTVALGGQQWTREECAARNIPGTPTLKGVVESVLYKGKLYSISYASSPDTTFAADRSKYFTPVEQSFTFLT